MENKLVSLKKIEVTDFSFVKVKSEKKFSNDELVLKTKIGHNFTKIDDSTAEVGIRVLLGDFSKQEPPYILRVTILGTFVYPNFESDQDGNYFMKNNSLAVLLPYVRSMVMQITTLGGCEPLVLPIINTFTFFGDQISDSKTTK